MFINVLVWPLHDRFEEEAFAVAISTYQILVAFATTIKIYRLMAEKYTHYSCKALI